MLHKRSVRAALVAGTILAALASAAQAKTLVYCSEGSPENFSPMLNTTGTTFDANAPIYNTIVQFKPGTTEIEPGLAEKWDISEDGKTYTFHLRTNAKWQSNKNFKPTRGVTADDIIFTFERQWKESNPYHKVGGDYSYFGDMGMPKLLSSIEKVDDHTVKFVLTKPNAPFLADLAMDFASIMSAEYADAMLKMGKPELIDQDPIGSGPYSLLQYQKDATIRYRAFDGYWGPKPPIDTLVFSINKEAAVRLAKLQANECQIMPYPNPADLKSIKANADLHVMEAPGLNIGYLAFNVQKKPLDDVRVRIAINEAIDKKAILDAVYQGAGAPAKNLIPPTMWSYNDKVQDFKYDPEDAKKLLEGGRAAGRLRDRSVGDAGAASLQPGCAAHRRADAVRPRQGRYQGEDRQLRMGRVPQARPERRAHDGRAGLDRRQRRSRQLLRQPRQLRRRPARRRQPDQVVQQGVRRRHQQGRRTVQAGGAHPALREGAGHHAPGRAVFPDRAFGGVHADAQERQRLHDEPARPASVRPCRSEVTGAARHCGERRDAAILGGTETPCRLRAAKP